MKKLLIVAAAAAITIGLTACSSDSGTAVVASEVKTESGSDVYVCGVNIPFPSGWTIYTGSEVYEQLLEGSDYDTADELKESYEENGMSCAVYAFNSDKTAIFYLNTQEITADETTGEVLTAEEYARNNHDTSVITYQANGFTIRGGSFSEETYGGMTGSLSKFEVCSDENAEELLMGQSEFTFEYNGNFCALQLYYSSDTVADEVSEIFPSIYGE